MPAGVTVIVIVFSIAMTREMLESIRLGSFWLGRGGGGLGGSMA